MNAFHNKPIVRKLARTILWIIPAFTLPFFVLGIAASGYLWPVVVIVYSAFIVGLGYSDTHHQEGRVRDMGDVQPEARVRPYLSEIGEDTAARVSCSEDGMEG